MHRHTTTSALEASFREAILQNRNNREILARWSDLNLPDAWLVAGCLFQTVWNLRSGNSPEAGIKDHDLFYFNLADLSEEGEREVQARVDRVLGDLGVPIEVCNQARVHLWYERHFGRPYEAILQSSCDGIDRFLIPATCVGMTPNEVYAPHGLSLLYEGVLAPNPLIPHHKLFLEKAASYRARWPWLRIHAQPLTEACSKPTLPRARHDSAEPALARPSFHGTSTDWGEVK